MPTKLETDGLCRTVPAVGWAVYIPTSPLERVLHTVDIAVSAELLLPTTTSTPLQMVKDGKVYNTERRTTEKRWLPEYQPRIWLANHAEPVYQKEDLDKLAARGFLILRSKREYEAYKIKEAEQRERQAKALLEAQARRDEELAKAYQDRALRASGGT